MKCISCNNNINYELINLGKIPLVNNFTKNFQVSNQKFKLCLVVCNKCKLIQVRDKVNPRKLFLNYRHYSSASIDQVNHLNKLSKFFHGNKDINKILEIGSNDNSLIKNFDNNKFFCCSVDPSVKKNLSNKHAVYKEFFNYRLSQKINKKYGKFDLIYAINVIPHVENLKSVLKGLSLLLKDNGKIIIEGVYLLNNISKGLFDTLYHEHVSNFSFYSLNLALKQFDLNIIDADLIKTQGGSFRVVCTKNDYSNNLKISNKYKNLIKKELQINIKNLNLYKNINNNLEKNIDNLKNKLENFYRKLPKNQNIVGVGGSARGVVITNVLNINNYLSAVIDDTLEKHGCYFPGTKSKIISWDNNKINESNYFIILSWNYKKTLIKKLKKRKKNKTFFVINILPTYSIDKIYG